MRTRFSGCSDSVVTTTACAADMCVIDSYNGDPRSARVAGVAVIVTENVRGAFAARVGAVVAPGKSVVSADGVTDAALAQRVVCVLGRFQ